MHHEDRAFSVEHQRRLALGSDPGPSPAEDRWRVKDGRYRWFSDTRSLVRDAEGRPAALVGTSRDLTDRRLLEEELRFQGAVLDSLGDAVVATDDAGRILSWGGSAEQIFVLRAEEAVGRPLFELLRSEVPEGGREAVAGRLAAGGSVTWSTPPAPGSAFGSRRWRFVERTGPGRSAGSGSCGT